jgi:hypothetical protein
MIWSRQGSSGLKEVPVVDPALIRRLDVGQAAYIYRGGVTYIQVKRVVAAPAAVARAHSRAASAAAGPIARHDDRPAAPAPHAAPASSTLGTRALADASSVLDAAFGPEPAP